MLWLVLALIYALFHSALSVLDRFVLRNKKIDSLSFSMVRFIFNVLIAIGTTFAFTYFTLPNDLTFWFYVIVIAIVYSIGTSTYFFAMKHEEASMVVPYGQSVTILLAFVLALVFLQESVTAFDVFGTLSIVFGTYVILSNGKLLKPKIKLLSKSMLSVVIWAIALAVFGVISKPASAVINPITLNMFLYSFVAVYLVFLNLAVNSKNMFRVTKLIISDKKLIILTIASSAFATIGTLMLLFALNLGNASEVLPVSRSLPLFVVILSWLFLKEREWKIRLIGSALIVLGIYGIYT